MSVPEFILILMLANGTIQATGDPTFTTMEACRSVGETVMHDNPELPWDTVPYVCVSKGDENDTAKIIREQH